MWHRGSSNLLLPSPTLEEFECSFFGLALLTTKGERAQKPREEMALVPRLSPVCSETSSCCLSLWGCAGVCLSSVFCHVCPSQQGHGLCSSIPLPLAPSSLKIIPVSINTVKQIKRKAKFLRAAGLKTVWKGFGLFKRKKQQFPFISNSRVMCSQSHVSAGKYLGSIKP